MKSTSQNGDVHGGTVIGMLFVSSFVELNFLFSGQQ